MFKSKMRILLLFLDLLIFAAAQFDYSAANRQEFNINANVQSQNYPATPLQEYKKEFYTYSAPESEFEDTETDSILAQSLQRAALRVVFIKAPENRGLEKAALQLAKSALEQQTVIYVLNKQTDITNLANQLNSLRDNTAHKPEVHFVKYRTEQDVENARQTIQSQYESLPGTAASHYAGSAPVLDFTSKSAQLSAVGGDIRPTYSASNSKTVINVLPSPPTTLI